MRVLVTGVGGLHRSGRERPTLAPRATTSWPTTGPSNLRTTSPTWPGVRSAADGCDAVVHLAAKVGLGVGIADIDDYARHNDLGTAVVLRASAEAGIRRLVFASSMVVYGEGAYALPAARLGSPGGA